MLARARSIVTSYQGWKYIWCAKHKCDWLFYVPVSDALFCFVACASLLMMIFHSVPLSTHIFIHGYTYLPKAGTIASKSRIDRLSESYRSELVRQNIFNIEIDAENLDWSSFLQLGTTLNYQIHPCTWDWAPIQLALGIFWLHGTQIWHYFHSQKNLHLVKCTC